MSELHDDAWEKFAGYLADTRRRMGDKWVPVALICLQADARPDGALDVKPWNDGAIVWPSGFPITERGPLLKRLSEPYRDGTVLR